MKTDSYLNTFVSNCTKKPTGNIGYVLSEFEEELNDCKNVALL